MPANTNPIVRNARHYSRWKRIKEGASIEKVAEDDRVKIETVRESYLLIEEQKSLYSMPVLETGQVKMIMSLQEHEQKSLREAFAARHKEFHETPNGTVVVEEIDHATALSASREITSRINSLHVRKGVNFNLNATATATSGASASIGDGKMSFESKLREILQKRKQEQEQPAAIDVPALPAGDDDDEDLE